MRVLRRVRYAQAVTAAIVGVLLAAVPRFVLVTLFDQVPYPEYAWVRIVGIQAIAGAMFAVLVAQRIEELRWWGWPFAITSALTFLVFGLNAVLGPGCEPRQRAQTVAVSVPQCSGELLWWTLTLITGALTAGFVLGLARAGQEAPPV